jgi:DNA-binding FadR family transcriptional regulator
LDVIGCLLALGDIPDSKLVAQILLVISSLVKTAAEAAVKRVNDDELEELCALVRPLHTEDLNEEAYTLARIAMMQGIMAASGNLPVQLIAQSLLQQFVPQMAPLEGFGDLDLEAHRALAKQLDEAMGQRDLPRMGEVFNDFLELHQLQVQQAFRAYKQAQQEATQEVALS